MAAEKPKMLEQEQYVSKYADQINAGLNSIVNREEFSYDPLKDANYQSMAKLYQKQGRQAAQNAMGDAAALNGGYGSSFAVTASQQAQNDYNQMLASQLPALQQAAYDKYLGQHQLNLTALEALRAADATDYAQYRDTVADNQWKYGTEYQAYRDSVGDTQWKTQYNRSVLESDRSYNYQKSRDKVADSQWKTQLNYQKDRDKVADSQWAKEYALSKKSAAASSRGSSNGYVGPSSDIGIDEFNAAWDATDEKTKEQTKDKGGKKKNTNKYANVTLGIWDQFLQNQNKRK